MSWEYIKIKRVACECGRGVIIKRYEENERYSTILTHEYVKCDYCNPKINLSHETRVQIDMYIKLLNNEYEKCRIDSGERIYKTGEAIVKQRKRLLNNPRYFENLMKIYSKIQELKLNIPI